MAWHLPCSPWWFVPIIALDCHLEASMPMQYITRPHNIMLYMHIGLKTSHKPPHWAPVRPAPDYFLGRSCCRVLALICWCTVGISTFTVVVHTLQVPRYEDTEEESRGFAERLWRRMTNIIRLYRNVTAYIEKELCHSITARHVVCQVQVLLFPMLIPLAAIHHLRQVLLCGIQKRYI